MKTRFLLGTNWKMFKTNTQAASWVTGVARLFTGFSPPPGLLLFAIPSFPSLVPVRALVSRHRLPLQIGAQNVHWAPEGEFTGEVSIPMLQDIPVDLVEIGHSERRHKFGEMDEDVNRKTLATLAAGLTALVCIGETGAEKRRDSGRALLARQLDAALRGVTPEHLSRLLVAYEPVWAIGEQGEPATPDYAASRHALLRALLAARFGDAAAARVPLLYGGSVNTDNYLDYARLADVDGLFVGRAAWTPEGFVALARGLTEKILSRS
ncbi:triosephosphate isomerase [Opitutaceae bacterium TAV1]|nr:triosephosphate isomerase [Opitutaceae bacterium TAV1]